MRSRAAPIALVALALQSCLVLGPPANRIPVLEDLTRDVVLPTEDDFASSSAALAAALQELESSPGEDELAAAQVAWRAARKPWKQSQAFAFGPAEDLRGAIDWSPTKPETIEAAIAGDEPITPASIEDLGSNAKGFMALEYLLFDPDGGEAAVLASMEGDGLAARRRAYARALGENLAAKARALDDAWDPTKGNYAAAIEQAGRGSSEFSSVKAARDAFVNEMVFLTELVADAQIGKPFGKNAGGVPQPDLAESRRSDNSIEDMLDHLRSVEHVYRGRYGEVDGLGVSDLVREKDPELDATVAAAIDDALAAVAAIPRPFENALTEHPGEVAAAYDAVKALKRLLSTEVVTALGATTKFNGNDGD